MNSGKADAIDELENSNSLPPPAATAPLKEEFRSALLSFTSTSLNGWVTGHSSTSDFSSYSTEGIRGKSAVNFIPNEAIRDLRCKAERMIDTGNSRECVQVYASVRKASMEESFKILGIEDLSSKSVQRLEWYVQQEKIRRWIRNAEICIRVLFAEERKLAEKIFKGLGKFDVCDVCFAETVNDHAVLLFNFAETISNGRKSPEKLFKILDLCNLMSKLLVDVETVFQSKWGESVRRKAVDIIFSLSDAARAILLEFEKAVIGEPTKVLMAGGSIHPLNEAVMNYIDSMVDYKQSLTELIVAKPSTNSSEIELDFPECEGRPLVLHLHWIINILKFNLKAKSKHYKDAALAHFFMMNNVHYIVHKIKGSFELREMMGEKFVNRLTVEYNVAASYYLRVTWKKVLDCLRNEGVDKLGSLFSGSVSMFVSRQRFKAFDAKFNDVVAMQGCWFVSDVQLRQELRLSILQMLIPVYTAFLHRHRRNVERLKQSRNCLGYSEEDVEKAVMSLFEG